MGFADESHLNKVFKSAYGSTAKEYHKSVSSF
jgi:AraC-like DNA-binding protein